MDTAVALYKDRLVKKVLVSGGVGDSGYNEALVMRDMAVKAGIRREDVIVDSSGVNTEATVRHSIPFFGAEPLPRVLAVSQFYHLPRIKLAYQRAGWDVLTVPARHVDAHQGDAVPGGCARCPPSGCTTCARSSAERGAAAPRRRRSGPSRRRAGAPVAPRPFGCSFSW